MSRQADFNRRKRAEGADIGRLPAVRDPERKTRQSGDLLYFLTEYFPLTTGLNPFSEEHIRAIRRIETVLRKGGNIANVFPRGFAKTTITENAVLWALLNGYRKFLPIFCANEDAALRMISSIKRELEQNDRLHEDFPEVCVAVIHLNGSPQRAWHQSHIAGNVEGSAVSEIEQTGTPQRTHIEWKSDTITLPTIYNEDGTKSPASGGRVKTLGIESGARGMTYKDVDGKQVRPDIAIIDDPQTDESARSPTQCTKRISIIQKTIMRLGSHNSQMAIIMNGTIIEPADVIEQMMNKKEFPSWQFFRIPMMKSMAKAHDTHWLDTYAKIRGNYDQDKEGDKERAEELATSYYQAHRTEMDEGAVATWEYCYIPGIEISAVQHAYNILIDNGPTVFASECQNEPTAIETGEIAQITIDKLVERIGTHDRGIVPTGCDKVTVGVDVQGQLLVWVAMAWNSQTFAGYVIDYGTWPEQPNAYWTLSSLKETLSKKYPAMEASAMFYAGLSDLKLKLSAKTWENEKGNTFSMSKGLIDYGYEVSRKSVFEVCRGTNELWLPSKGKGITVKQAAWETWAKQEGMTYGTSWRIARKDRGSPWVLFETNYWKTHAYNSILTAVGSITQILIYKAHAQNHRLLFENYTAERAKLESFNGRTIIEWDDSARRPEHFWDATVLACVSASIIGVKTPEQQPAHRPRVQRSLKDLQAERRASRRRGG